MLRRGALLEDSVAEHGNALSERHRLDLIVGHVHGGDAETLVQQRQLVAHRHAELGVEVGEWLVHQEHARFTHDRAAHRDPLALAPRQRRRSAVEQRCQSERVGDLVDARECRSAIEGLLAAGRKAELGWLVEAEQLPKPAAKVLLNLAMIAGDALVRGGRLDIGAERASGATEIVIRAEGPRLLLDPNLRATLERGAAGTVEPRAAGAWLAHALITEAGGKLQISPPDSQVLMIGALF